jgi:hypothetical protein
LPTTTTTTIAAVSISMVLEIKELWPQEERRRIPGCWMRNLHELLSRWFFQKPAVS